MQDKAIRFLCLMKICLGVNTMHEITILTFNGESIPIQLPCNNRPKDLWSHPQFCQKLTDEVGLYDNVYLVLDERLLTRNDFPLLSSCIISIIRDTPNIHSLCIPIKMTSAASCVLLGNFEKIKDRISELVLTFQQINLFELFLNDQTSWFEEFKGSLENPDIKQLSQYSEEQLSVLKEIEQSMHYTILKFGDRTYKISWDSGSPNSIFEFLLNLKVRHSKFTNDERWIRFIERFIKSLKANYPSHTIEEITHLVPGLD